MPRKKVVKSVALVGEKMCSKCGWLGNGDKCRWCGSKMEAPTT